MTAGIALAGENVAQIKFSMRLQPSPDGGPVGRPQVVTRRQPRNSTSGRPAQQENPIALSLNERENRGDRSDQAERIDLDIQIRL